MRRKIVNVDESFLEQFSKVYTSIEQGVNSSVSMWNNIKKHNEMCISCSLTKNECMYMIEFLAAFNKSISYTYEGDPIREIDDIMICGIKYPSEKELDIKWECNLIRAESAFSDLNEICKYIVIEWAIMYRDYNEAQKKIFEKYIEDLYKTR